jgi:hypothetical protein
VKYLPLITALCKREGWPQPVSEHRFHDTRRWRFDLAWVEQRVALEVNGGVFVAGRHSRGAGQMKDFEKLNAAQLAGWKVLQVTPKQLTDGTLQRLLADVFRVAA